MSQYYTDQDRIDEQTMRIENPNIVGSGYIQFPPQRPFEKPVQVQPPTVAHLEYPQEYQQYSGTGQPPKSAAPSSTNAPQANGNARGPGTPSLPQGANSSTAQPRQAVPQTQGLASARPGHPVNAQPPANYAAASNQAGAGRPPQQRQAQSGPGQPLPHQHNPVSSAPHSASINPPSTQQRPAPSTNGYQTPMPQARAVLRPTAASTSVAPAPAVAASNTEENDDDDDAGGAGLSKAQKKRLRKKMREGGA